MAMLVLMAAPAHADPLKDRLQAGLWGSDHFRDQMCDNPHRIRLAQGDRRMIFTWQRPIRFHTGALVTEIGATVVARTFDRYTVVQDGDDRLGRDGTALQFDVFVTAKGGYCFFETGFGVVDCPHPNRDCGKVAATS